jgi:hypothetical protein
MKIFYCNFFSTLNLKLNYKYPIKSTPSKHPELTKMEEFNKYPVQPKIPMNIQTFIYSPIHTQILSGTQVRNTFQTKTFFSL